MISLIAVTVVRAALRTDSVGTQNNCPDLMTSSSLKAISSSFKKSEVPYDLQRATVVTELYEAVIRRESSVKKPLLEFYVRHEQAVSSLASDVKSVSLPECISILRDHIIDDMVEYSPRPVKSENIQSVVDLLKKKIDLIV